MVKDDGSPSVPSKADTSPSLPMPAVSMLPLVTSRSQSPPRAALPVESFDAATSAPVAIASCSTKLLAAPVAQPYSRMSPFGVRLLPIACNCAV